MNNYELYINKQPVDLETKFTFGLIYQSPVFTDISKIVSNRTTTIKIPKTANNLRIVENCQMPDYNGVFPYNKQEGAELWKNGIPIILNGEITLLAINEAIELSILWGIKFNVNTLQNLKLRDMTGSDYVTWNDNASSRITNTNKAYGFAVSDFGFGDIIYYKHPFVSLNWILAQIEEDTEMSFATPNNIAPEIEKIYFPLIEKKTNDTTILSNNFTFRYKNNYASANYTAYLNPVLIDDRSSIMDISERNYYNSIEVSKDVNVFFNANFKLKVTSNSSGMTAASFRIMTSPTNSIQNVTPLLNIPTGFELGENDTTYILSVELTKANSYLEIEKGFLFFAVYADRFITGITDADADITAYIESETVYYQSDYPIVTNLPDITALDFVKNFMFLFGLFAYYDTVGANSAIRFFSVDEIYNRIPNAKDWTQKLAAGNQIDNITFSFQDYAQKNYIRYLKDETVTTNADGSIDVNNNTLEKEKNIAELKFAPSDEYSNKILIPLYSKEEAEEGELSESKYEKTSNRIAYMELGETTSTARFSNKMYFDGDNGRIARFYEKYQEILLRPKVIEATFLLNELDLHNIDLLTPVYLEQTGQYYAIIDINMNEDKAKCKLLQM